MKGLKSFNKRIVSLLIVMVMLSLTACGSEDTTNSTNTGSESTKKAEEQPKDNAKKENKELKLVYKENPSWEQWLSKVKTDFEKQNEGITINLLPIKSSEGDFFAKLALMMQTEGAVDIVTEDTFMINSDVAAGYLAPLDGIEEWSEWDAFYNNVKAGVTSKDNKVYGIPYSTDTRGLFYNSEILENVGVSIPWEPKTWDEVLDVCRKIKNETQDVIPIWFNSGKATGEATTMQTFEMLLYGTNDTLYEDGKWVVNSEGFLDSLNFIDTVYREELGAPLSKVLGAKGGDYAKDELIPQGKVAIFLDGNWTPKAWWEGKPGEWAEAEKIMKLAPMPTQKGQEPGNVSMSGGWALSINADSKHKEEAFEFIKFATNKENLMYYSTTGSSLTPRKDVSETPDYLKDNFRKMATDFLAFTHYRPASEQYPGVSAEIQTAVEAVAVGELTPEQAMEQFATNVERVVGEENIMKK